jgi:hypothetical protein
MRVYRGVVVLLHSILTSVLNGEYWSASRLDRVTLSEIALGTCWTGSWLWLGARLDDVANLKYNSSHSNS